MQPGGGSLIEDYRLFCSKEKAIYATLNMYEGTEAMLRSNCWFPEAEEEEIRRMLLSFSTPNQVKVIYLILLIYMTIDSPFSGFSISINRSIETEAKTSNVFSHN